MRRRLRRSASGTLPADALSPLLRMVALLIVLGLIYSWARKPGTWTWLADNVESPAEMIAASESPEEAPPATTKATRSDETVVPGPTDLDSADAADAHRLLEAVSDRSPLAEIEMPAYWKLMKWARAQSFADLRRRATSKFAMTQLWEQPDKYRGKLLLLKLHIKRILDFKASANSAGVSRVYEAWGWTDESKSYPYVVVFSELPEGMKIGADVQEEGVFVGYFLKTLSYTAYNAKRSAPLLIGRMIRSTSAATPRPVVARHEWFWILTIGFPLLLVALSGIWFQLYRMRRVKMPNAPRLDESEIEDWFRNGAPRAKTDHGLPKDQGPVT